MGDILSMTHHLPLKSMLLYVRLVTKSSVSHFLPGLPSCWQIIDPTPHMPHLPAPLLLPSKCPNKHPALWELHPCIAESLGTSRSNSLTESEILCLDKSQRMHEAMKIDSSSMTDLSEPKDLGDTLHKWISKRVM